MVARSQTAEHARLDLRWTSSATIRPSLQPTALLEAVVAVVPDDDVVEHLHAEQHAGINEASRQLDVVGAWDRVAAGMIVRLMCPATLCGPVVESRAS